MSLELVCLVLLGYLNSSEGYNLTSIGVSRESKSGYHQAPEHHHHYADGAVGHGHGGGSFQSFFDIALTGLAFLSFGIFLLNLLLNALIGAGYVTGTILPTNTGTGIITDTATGGGGTSTSTGGGTATGTDPSPETRSARTKRGVPLDLHLDPVSSMDAMAAVVLKSIDAMVEKHECVSKVFCDGNKEARIVGTGFQYLMPAYSLGASYIARKIGLHDCMPDHLGAILHGIDETNCQAKYPQCL